MVKIVVMDGVLYQWDTGRKIQVLAQDGTTVEEVHFAQTLDGDALVAEVANSIAPIPNLFLQSSNEFYVYAVVVNPDKTQTIYSRTVSVMARAKPNDYVYTEEEILAYRKLEQRIDEIEKNGVSDKQIETAVNKYLDENPIDPLPPVTEADNGKVMTVMNGMWAAAELPKYDGEYEVTPLADESTTLLTKQKFMDSNVVVNKVPYYETSNTDGGETVYIATEVDIYGD